MPTTDIPMTRAVLLAPLINHFTKMGGDADRLLSDMHLPLDLLTTPDTPVAVKAVYDTAEEISRRLNDTFVGAVIGRDMARDQIGPLTRDSGSASSVGEFLNAFVLSVQGYGNSTEYRLETDRSFAKLHMSRRSKPDATPAQPDAIGLSFLVEHVRIRMGPQFDAADVLAVVSDETVIPDWVLPGTSVLTGGDRGITLRLPASWLVPNHALNERFVEDMNQSPAHQVPRSVSDLVRDHCLQQVGNAEFNLATVSQACRMRPRSLERQLAAEDTSFRKILDDVRKQTALALVVETERPLTKIAMETGFTTPSSFTRAFRRWTGMSPSDKRASLQFRST